ncbi:MAG TPA: DUF362 domain-containing protein, partial [Acidobacteriota bacterium]|nr:DUF362 domain-containing protein [Acidobacteriota bacterium]
ANTMRAVENLGGMEVFVPKGSKIAILANPQRNNPGAFTKPDILRAAIQMCQQSGAASITCISQLPDQNWEATGLKKVVEDEGANLIIVDKSDDSQFRTVPVPKGKILTEAQIMNEFFNYDVFIDMPITKDHAGNKFTGTMKNLMGLSSPKTNRSFHKKGWQTDINAIDHLEQCIADLNTIIQPDLCIVDATEFITTNGPFGPGEIIKPKKVIAGTDRVAVDSYCCSLWGLEGKDILQITKAFNHGLGEIDLNQVKIKEVSV